MNFIFINIQPWIIRASGQNFLMKTPEVIDINTKGGCDPWHLHDHRKSIQRQCKECDKENSRKSHKNNRWKGGSESWWNCCRKRLKKIRQLLQERKKKQMSKDAQNKLANILQNKLPKKSDEALIKLNRILTNEI